MQVSEIMTRNVFACRPEDSVKTAAKIMRAHDCGSVPVLDGRNELIGILTDRDICLAASEHDEPLDSIQIADALSWEPLTCHPDDELEAIEKKLAEHQVRRLPVTDRNGSLIGIISLGDIARAETNGRSSASGEANLASAVAAISEPTVTSRIHP